MDFLTKLLEWFFKLALFIIILSMVLIGVQMHLAYA